jgi:predicted exporter
MGYILPASTTGYTYTYWRIAHIDTQRQAEQIQVTFDLRLYKDKAAANIGAAHVAVEQFTASISRDDWTTKTGTQQLRWLYQQISLTDKFTNADDDE